MKIHKIFFLVFMLSGCTKVEKEIHQITISPDMKSNNGDRIGNGGGAWTCTDMRDNIRWIEFIDFFEAKNEFKLSLIFARHHSYDQLVQFKREWLFTYVPELLHEIDPYLVNVSKNLSFIDSDLEVINDTLYRIRPTLNSCKEGKISYQQIANFTLDGRVLINRRLWDHPQLDEQSKAALLFHEAIYQWLREKADDSNSVRTRSLVGIIFSSLYPWELRKKADDILRLWGKDPRSNEVENTQVNFEEFYLPIKPVQWATEIEDENDSEIVMTSLKDGSIHSSLYINESSLRSLVDYDFQLYRQLSSFKLNLKKIKSDEVPIWTGSNDLSLSLQNGQACFFTVSVQIQVHTTHVTAFIQYPTLRELQTDETQSIKPRNCDDFVLKSLLSRPLTKDHHRSQ